MSAILFETLSSLSRAHPGWEAHRPGGRPETKGEGRNPRVQSRVSPYWDVSSWKFDCMQIRSLFFFFLAILENLVLVNSRFGIAIIPN